MIRSAANAGRSRGASVDMILEFELEQLVAPVVLSERLFPLHPQVASGQGTDGVLETLAGRSEAEDMLPVRIARAVNNYDRGADDLLVVIEKE